VNYDKSSEEPVGIKQQKKLGPDQAGFRTDVRPDTFSSSPPFCKSSFTFPYGLTT